MDASMPRNKINFGTVQQKQSIEAFLLLLCKAGQRIIRPGMNP